MHLFPFVKKYAINKNCVYNYYYGGMTNKMNEKLFHDVRKAYDFKIRALNKYNYSMGYIYSPTELNNFISTYIESYFKYTKITKQKLINKLNKEINEEAFVDAILKHKNSKYNNQNIELLYNEDFE